MSCPPSPPRARGLLAAALLVSGLFASVRAAVPQDRVILRDGLELSGRIVEANGKEVRIAVDFGEVRIRRAHVVGIRPVAPGTASAPAWRIAPLAPKPPRPPSAASRPAPPRRSPAPPPAAASADEGSPSAAEVDRPPPPPFDDRVEDALSRYLWFVPVDTGQRIAFGAALLIGLTLVTLFASRMAEVEHRSLARSFFLSSSLLGLGGISLHLHSIGVAGLPVLATGALLVWFVLARLVLRTGLFRALVFVACLVLCVLLGVLWAEVAQLALYDRPQFSA